MPRYLHLTSIKVTSHFHPGPENFIWAPSRSNLKHIQAWRCASQFHPGPVPPSSRLSSIQTTFHLNTCPDICIPHPSRSRKFHPNSILVPSHRIQVAWCAPQLNPGPISAPPRCRYLCFTSIQVTPNSDPGHEIYISPPKRFPLTCIQVAGFASQLHPGAISVPFSKICI